MGVGPLLGSVAIQWYIFVAVRNLSTFLFFGEAYASHIVPIDEDISPSASSDHSARLRTLPAHSSQG